MYVFDASPLSVLLRNFYPDRFPTLWKNFDALIREDKITSTREVRRELERIVDADIPQWLEDNKTLFPTPTAEEAEWVTKIYAVRNFQHNITQQDLLRGGYNADAFVIARAKTISGLVVTQEKASPNSARIPNICRHFQVPCCNFEEFMQKEGWKF